MPCAKPQVRVIVLTVVTYFTAFTITSSPHCWSQDNLPDKIGARKSLESLMEELSDDRFSKRQQATLRIWGQRDQLREQVREASRHPDPEVAGRAKWILRQWRRGSTPDLPDHIARLVQQGDDPAAINELVEYGKLDAAIIAIEESTGMLEYPAIKQRIADGLRQRFPFHVERAIETDSLADLVRLVDIVADEPDLALCRLRLMQTLGMPIDDANLLPAGAQSLNQFQRTRLAAAIHVSLGQNDDAIRVARQTQDQALEYRLLEISARWQELAELSYKKARATPVAESLRFWFHTLIAADRCGDLDKRNEAVKAITTLEFGADALGSSRWKVLAMHGLLDEALSVVNPDFPEVYTDLALASSTPEIAFDKLGFALDEVDEKLDSWIESALAEQIAATESSRTVLGVRKLLCLMKCLLAVGRKDAGWEIAETLCKSKIEIGRPPSARKLRPEVLRVLALTPFDEWVPKLAVFEGETSVSLSSLGYVARVLSDADNATFTSVMGAMLVMNRRMPYHERYRMVCDLFAGEIPVGFDEQREFERIYDYLSRVSQSPFRQEAQRQSRSQINRDLVDFFAKHGKAEIANKCLQHLMRRGDVQAMYDLAIQQTEKGNADTASSLFESIWNGLRRKGVGSSNADAVLAAKTLIQRWFIAKCSGDLDLADQLYRQIELTMCAPSKDFLNEVAHELADHGQEDLASEVYRHLLPLSAVALDDDSSFYDIARNYSTSLREREGFESVRWFDLAVLQTIESPYFRSTAYVSLPLYVRRWGLEQAINSKVVDIAEQNINRIVQLNSLDINFAEELLPKARDAGMIDLADKTVDEIVDRGVEYNQRFPFDTTTTNNIAWVAAVNNRRLDDALQLSESTVFLEPNSAIYRDTLAEILFRLERKEEALLVEEACLLDDPTQWHLHSQVEKYQKAISDR